jgi:hypothetical protein
VTQVLGYTYGSNKTRSRPSGLRREAEEHRPPKRAPPHVDRDQHLAAIEKNGLTLIEPDGGQINAKRLQIVHKGLSRHQPALGGSNDRQVGTSERLASGYGGYGFMPFAPSAKNWLGRSSLAAATDYCTFQAKDIPHL